MADRDGLQLVGEFLGFGESQWSSGTKSGVDRFIVIRTGARTDEYGVTVEDAERVRIFDDALMMFYRENDARLKGKRVAVPVVAKANKGGRTGAWLQLFQPKGTVIRPAPSVEKAQAAA